MDRCAGFSAVELRRREQVVDNIHQNAAHKREEGKLQEVKSPLDMLLICRSYKLHENHLPTNGKNGENDEIEKIPMGAHKGEKKGEEGILPLELKEKNAT